MERRIQYATAPDGTRIAHWTLGQGEPLVYLAGGPWNHIEVWEAPQCRAWYERLARHRTLVRYDARGTGLSDREVNDFSLDAQVGDLEAVVEALGLTRFDLFAAGDAGPVAIAYAVRHPERVGRCVLWCAWARGSDFEASPRMQAWRGLIDQDWDLMAETCAHLAFGWDESGIGRQAAEAFRASITRETAQAALEATVSTDVTDSLPRMNAPTLVMHRSGISWLPVEIARNLAARLPDGHLVVLEGESTAPYVGDFDALAQAVLEFLGSPDGAVPDAGALEARASASAANARPGSIQSPRQRNLGVVEILPFHLDGGSIVRDCPAGAPSWQVTFEPAAHPGAVVGAELARRGCEPLAVHSTSWRIEEDRLVLTYAAVLPGPLDRRYGFSSTPAERRELARGSAISAPERIGIEEVAEHALRHLAWLAREDRSIIEALGQDWLKALSPYQPEPFSSFDLSGALSEEDGCLLCTRFSRPLAEFVNETSVSAGTDR